MNAQEVLRWMAYEMANNPDKNKDYLKEIAQEKRDTMSHQDSANAIAELLINMSK